MTDPFLVGDASVDGRDGRDAGTAGEYWQLPRAAIRTAGMAPAGARMLQVPLR